MLKQIRKESGFTIIELLIVIAIIGILATLVLTNFRGAQAKGRDTVRKNDINSLYQKLEEYYNENGSYINEAVTFENAAEFFPSIDIGAVTDQDGSVIRTTFSTSTTTPPAVSVSNTPGEEYQLILWGDALCASGGTCTKYVLAAFQETDPENPYVKTSLN
jgi:prepilin-type N-terminal cleavage/methylation domain-containing protein